MLAMIMDICMYYPILYIYSILAALRCAASFDRKYFSQLLTNKGEKVPEWYFESLDKKHNKKYMVKYVLCGWIISNSLIYIFSLFIYIYLTLNFELFSSFNRQLYFILALTFICILYFGISKPSYKIGEKICKWKKI